MTLKQWIVLSVLACALSSTGVTLAADLSVNGHIRSGGACDVALGNGGVADFGNVSRKENFPTSHHVFSRNIPLAINCQHPTKVGLDVIDNRKGTAPKDRPYYFGLGNPAIGCYTINNNTFFQVDGKKGYRIGRWKGETTWQGMGVWSQDATYSWDLGGPQSEPVAFEALTGTLNITVNPRYDSVFTDELEFDGSATLELVYL
ncbi:DUF1120 domain-containing protein [Burkholderia sp. SCN-KJ]|uniref:DUF1120 domain-containing protein n=1 Tax=Burkholderia sp. SCN-KJ TaxID=2969248 RepID=UPI00214FF755|nr:DUF1120 domain-containing protein [Burkholderia sp. SCN-KJ]MCR4465547.1 DUF1120 domain-containing protein [Burkholderia sp. SCN-KJ]